MRGFVQSGAGFPAPIRFFLYLHTNKIVDGVMITKNHLRCDEGSIRGIKTYEDVTN